MGSDESHFNVSVGSDGQSHKTVSTNHRAQRTGFNTLDNWGHKTPTQSKKDKETGKKS